MNAAFLREIDEALRLHRRIVMATIVEASGSTPRSAGSRILVLPGGSIRGSVGGGKFESLVIVEATEMLARGTLPVTRDFSFLPDGPDSFGAVCGGSAKVLFELVERPPCLLVVGGGHCGRALARVASCTGWDVTVVDDRADVLDPGAFPKTTRLVSLANDLSDLPLPGPADFVAVVSRGHETDGLALRRLRGVPVAYLGMIGSRAKRNVLFSALRSEGWTDEETRRVRTPIGLDIGAETPGEIAISIVAEMIAALRSRGTG